VQCSDDGGRSDEDGGEKIRFDEDEDGGEKIRFDEDEDGGEKMENRRRDRVRWREVRTTGTNKRTKKLGANSRSATEAR
jgi:hypothetical protein